MKLSVEIWPQLMFPSSIEAIASPVLVLFSPFAGLAVLLPEKYISPCG